MRPQRLFDVALFLLGTACLGSAKAPVILMNHVDPVGLSLQPIPFLGYSQIFPDYPFHSSMVVDDVDAPRGTITRVWTVIETPNDATDLNLVEAYRISVWSNVFDAGLSGNDLTGRTIASQTVAPSQASITELFGTGALHRAFLVELPTAMYVANGRIYLGVSPVLLNESVRITYAMNQLNPSVLGAGTPLNAYFVNPGKGFGFGPLVQVPADAALTVEARKDLGLLFASVPPSRYRIQAGRRITGDLVSLQGPDDDVLRLGVFMVPNAVAPPIIAEFLAYAPRVPQQNLGVAYRTRAASQGSFAQTVEMYDYADARYDMQRFETDLGPTYGNGEHFATNPPVRYLALDQEMKARFSFRATAPTAVTLWDVDIDSVRWNLYD